MAQTSRINLPITRNRWPAHVSISGAPALDTSSVSLNSANDRVAIIGHVEWADGASHDLRTVYIRTGGSSSPSLTLAWGPRDVDAANGPAGRDDGTPDETVTQVNPASATNYGAALSADRTLAHGALIAITCYLSAYTSGAINIAGLSGTTGQVHRPLMSYFNDPTWSVPSGVLPIVTLEAADGTFGLLRGALPRISATINTHTFNSGSAADEIGMEFTVGGPIWVDGAGFLINPAAGADFSVVLYNGTTEMVAVAVDANTWQADATVRWIEVGFAPQALTSGNTYRLVVKPTTANNVSIYSFDVSAAGHLAAFAGSSKYVDRVDADAWNAATTTRHPFCYINISGVDDGTGGAAGGAVQLVGGGLVR